MNIRGLNGFNDILPDEIEKWQAIEKVARRVFGLYGFSEIRTPILESTDLFCRSIGESTDIVEKEMYSFEDKGKSRITMRPEGTASVLRALIEHKLYAQDPIQRLYYMGPMFRFERPQRGRFRQFHQIGVEMTGASSPVADAQLLAMLTQFFREVGLSEPSLQLNSLGCPACRPSYREALRQYLAERLDLLCPDCNRRYLNNPLRALDCKVPQCREATAQAPALLEFLCSGCSDHFSATRRLLDLSGTEYRIDSRMVRGLDYYTRTTFEMVTGQLGSQSAVAAGGRYDGLCGELGGPALPGIGFALGVERVALLMDPPPCSPGPDLFVAALGTEARDAVFPVICRLQQAGFAVDLDYEGKSLKSQMRRANKSQARFTLIVGPEEIATGMAQLKRMSTGEQGEIALNVEQLACALQAD